MRSLIAALLVVSPYLVACTPCPTNDLPTSCPDGGAPSYLNEVAPIMSQECVQCHSAGGQDSTLPLDSYAAVFAQRQEILDQIYSCQMPQGGSLDVSQRATLLTWFVCGAPNN